MPKTTMISEIMSRNVIYLNEEDNLTRIVEGMKRYNLRHLPVVSEGKLVGLISHRDMLKLATSSLVSDSAVGKAMQEELNERTEVEKVMTKNPTAIRPETTVRDAAQIMLENKFGCLPVVTEDMTIVGIVTEYDLLKFLIDSYS
ncbi:MAG: CBS domain-containing protein [Deltaproteobacteria bacterium]|nr:CBS domain-containing protein [Deltaproteobacteria bacterium]